MNRTSFRTIGLFIFALAFATSQANVSHAIDTDWVTPGTSDWTIPGNWSPGIPGGSDTARIGKGGTASINSLVNSINYLYVGHAYSANNGDGTVDLNTGANLSVANEVYLKLQPGYNGTINHNAGTLNIGTNLNFDIAGGTGTTTYNLSGGSLNFTNASPAGRIINMYRQATFNFNSGTLSGNPIINIGNAGGAFKSVFNLGGNTLNASQIWIEQAPGTGVADEFNFQGGTVNASQHFLIGGSQAPGGTVVSLGNNESLITPNLYVGYANNGAATFNHNGAGTSLLNVATMLTMADGTGNERDYFNQNSGTLAFGSSSSQLLIARDGTFNFNGGSITGSPVIYVGNAGGAYQSIFNLGGNTLNASQIWIESAPGTGAADQFNFQGGTVNATQHFLLGGSQAVGGTVVNLGNNESLTTLNLYVGYANNGQATFNHNGAGTSQLNVGSSLFMSDGTGNERDYFNQNTGTLNFNGGTKQLFIARDGTFNFNGGSIAGSPNVEVGNVTGAYKSIFNLGGNTLNAAQVWIEKAAGSGVADEFNFQGGTVNASQHFLVGGSQASGGTVVTMATGETLTTPTLYVGFNSNAEATLEINGGQVNVTNSLEMSNGTGSETDYFKLNSGTVNFNTTASINFNGQGVIGNYGGTMTGINNFYLGTSGAGLAKFEQTAGTTSMKGQMIISYNGSTTGEFNLSGGTFTQTNPIDTYMWRSSTANVSGTGVLNFGRDLNVGWVSGTSDFNQSGGTVNVPGTIHVAPNAGLSGSYDLSGGTLNLTGPTSDLLLERNASMTISGGLANVARNMSVGTASGSTAVVNQTDGRIVVANTLNLATVAGAGGTYNLSGGELKVGTLDLTNAGNDVFNLNGGKLSAVVIDNADGILNFTSGMLSPGLVGTPQTMTINTGLVIPAAGGLQMDLTTPNVLGGGVNDLLVVNGNLTLDGILSVAGAPVGDYPFLTFTGSLTDLGMETLFPLTQSIFVVLNPGGGGTVWLSVIPVPEPSSMTLLGLGLLALKRRRRARKA